MRTLWGIRFKSAASSAPENVELLLLVSHPETGLKDFPVVARRVSNSAYGLPDDWWTGTPGNWSRLDRDVKITHWRELGDLTHWREMNA